MGKVMRKIVYRAVTRSLLQPWFRLRRGITLGVRAAVINGASEVLLVRHTYAPGWILPGGGVERGETVLDAVKREVREEAGVIVTQNPILHGVFANEDNFPGDHLVCYIIREFTLEPRPPSIEIAEARFFAIDALPEATTGGSRRRIAEIAEGAAIQSKW